MSAQKTYYYLEERCEFIPHEEKGFDAWITTASTWILNGTVFAGILLVVLAGQFGTPSYLVLKEENEHLIRQMEVLDHSLVHMEAQMERIKTNDNQGIRSILGLPPLEEVDYLAGTGGSDPLQDFDLYSERASEVLRRVIGGTRNLEHSATVQQNSFEELQSHHQRNQELMQQLPAIKPVNGIILSRYGMRVHPVLNYRRMHQGLDFRARRGTPIYATGDGVVKRTGRNGSYGLMITVQHHDQLETRYAHLSAVAEGVHPGVEVSRGTKIGYSGNTGMTDGPHLHYEVFSHGKAVDPAQYIISGTRPEDYRLWATDLD